MRPVAIQCSGTLTLSQAALRTNGLQGRIGNQRKKLLASSSYETLGGNSEDREYMDERPLYV